MSRRTLASRAEVTGPGLHTGHRATVSLGPAASGSGLGFVRVDLPGRPRIPARTSEVIATERRTALGRGEAQVQTVEHLLAALHGLGIDDADIEVAGGELPIIDGAFTAWVEAIDAAGVTEQEGEPAVITVRRPFTVQEGDARYVVAPAPTLRITATVEWDHPSIGRQSLLVDIGPDSFRQDIAGARTFGFVHEVELLRERGLLQGATSDMAVVLSATGVESGALRWPNEFVRHKIGDLVGDLALLGARVEGHIMTERPSHQGNVALASAMARQADRHDPTALDVTRIMQVMPHRYPFLLVDRILEIEAGIRLTALKNVTINEPFFQGHFPGHPIMPGVLIVEAMAQAGGMLLMDHFEDPESKLVYFMSIDGVKFRKPVVPGDQLRFELTMLQFRGRRCRMRGEAFVDGQIACEAEMMASVVDR
jgi:UDP-3-O-[3-hydroxymyristoyl] N-acetylglucosamine deacetylase/3-hydroxyacyl-[acyl-carrier-protein] dehydratase